MALESYKSENLHLIKEALDYTRVGLTVTALPDNPFIYVNKGFLDMTGTELIVTGIKPNLAMKMGEMREDCRGLNTLMNVKSALKNLQI